MDSGYLFYAPVNDSSKLQTVQRHAGYSLRNCDFETKRVLWTISLRHLFSSASAGWHRNPGSLNFIVSSSPWGLKCKSCAVACANFLFPRSSWVICIKPWDSSHKSLTTKQHEPASCGKRFESSKLREKVQTPLALAFWLLRFFLFFLKIKRPPFLQCNWPVPTPLSNDGSKKCLWIFIFWRFSFPSLKFLDLSKTWSITLCHEGVTNWPRIVPNKKEAVRKRRCWQWHKRTRASRQRCPARRLIIVITWTALYKLHRKKIQTIVNRIFENTSMIEWWSFWTSKNRNWAEKET